MLRSVFTKSLRDSRWPVLGWGLGLTALLLIRATSYAQTIAAPAEREDFSRLINGLPPAFKALLGDVINAATLEGLLQIGFFAFFPALLAIWLILRGTFLVAGEEERGYFDVLLSLPISRVRYVAEQFAGLVVSLLAIVGLIAGSLLLVNASNNLGLDPGRALGATLNALPTALVIATGALFFSALLGQRRKAGTIMALLVVASYLLNTLGALVDSLRPLRDLSIFYLYNRTTVLIDGYVDWTAIAIQLVIAVVLFAAALWAVQARDLDAETGLIGQLWRRKHEGRPAPARPRLERLPRSVWLRGVLAKSLRDIRGIALVWGIGIGLYCAWVLSIYPSFSQSTSLANSLNNLPPAARALVGQFSDLTAPAGFFNLVVLTYLPLLVAIYALIQATGTLAGEEEQGIFSVLLSAPVSRARLVLDKIGGLVIGLVVVSLFAVGCVLLGIALTGISLDYGKAALAVLTALPPALVISAVSFLAGALLGSRAAAVGVGTLLTVGAYFLNTLGSTVDWLKPLRGLSIFYQAAQSRPFDNEWGLGNLALLVGVAALAYALSLIVFQRRDLKA